MTLMQHRPGVPETSAVPTQPTQAAPSYAWPIFFGIIGAWTADTKAKKLGYTDTKRYWIVGAISSVVIFAVTVLPLIAIFALGLFATATEAPSLTSPQASAPVQGSGQPQAPVQGSVQTSPSGDVATEVTASSPLADRVKVAEGLPEYTSDTITAKDTGAVIFDRMNAEWMNAAIGDHFNPDPRYLWSFMDTSLDLYKQASSLDKSKPFNATVSAQIILPQGEVVNEPAADPFAEAGKTTRTYTASIYANGLPDALSMENVHVTVKFEAGHWIITKVQK